MPRALKAELVYWPASASMPSAIERPDIDDPLPEGPWVTLEEDFTVFWGINTAWASYDAHVAPGHSMGGGTWKLALLKNKGRVPLADFLLGLEDGKHATRAPRGVEVVECRAFRLTPRCTEGLLSLDGEEVPLAPIQVWPNAHSAAVLGSPWPSPGTIRDGSMV